jgi:hypothetical protein
MRKLIPPASTDPFPILPEDKDVIILVFAWKIVPMEI